MTEQELYKLVESIVREELTRRGADEEKRERTPCRSSLITVFT